MAERLVDFVAAGRVAKRIDLKDIRVTSLSGSCEPSVAGPLETSLDLRCEVISSESNMLQITCDYHFTAHSNQVQAAEASVKYLLVYEVQGNEPLAEEDVSEFALASGTLHSWPFVREFLYALTSRMGYPPYTLPVFHFKPKPRDKKEAGEQVIPEQSVPKSTG